MTRLLCQLCQDAEKMNVSRRLRLKGVDKSILKKRRKDSVDVLYFSFFFVDVLIMIRLFSECIHRLRFAQHVRAIINNVDAMMTMVIGLFLFASVDVRQEVLFSRVPLVKKRKEGERER